MDHQVRGSRPVAGQARARLGRDVLAAAMRRLRRPGLALLALAMPALACAADLQITNLSDTGYDPTPAGGTIVYSVTVENSDADTVNDAVVIFDLPAGAHAGSPLPAGCSVAAGNAQRMVCQIGTLVGTFSSNGAPVTLQLPVSTTGLAPGTVEIRGAIGFSGALPDAGTPITALGSGDDFFAGDGNSANNVRVEATTLESAGDLSIEKTATPDPVIGGGEVTYTVTVRNAGPSASANFTVVDDLPAAVQYVASSFNGSGWSFNSGSMTATHGGALAEGGSATFSFRGKVNAGSGNIVNTARVTPAGTPDPLPDNNVGSVATEVTAGADLALSKSATPAPAISGQPITFNIQVRNEGPSAAVNPSFVDNLPTGFLVTGGTAPAGWTCSDGSGNTSRTCTLAGSLAVGAVADFTIESVVPATGTNASGDVSNSATVSSQTPDAVPANNTGSTTFTVLADGADLSLQKSKTPALVPVWSGTGSDVDSRMTSRITVRNHGPRAATGQVQVVDTLASGEELLLPDGSVASPGVAFTAGAWTCSVDHAYSASAVQHVTCDLGAGSLAVGAQAPVLQLLTRARTSAANLLNNACAGGSGGSLEPLTGDGIDRDPVDTNDCAGAGSRTTDERADLSIAKQSNGPGDVDNTLAANQDTLSYTLTVTNSGPDSTTGVVVNDTIPGFVNGRTQIEVTTTPPGWNCTVNGASVTCRSGTTSLANGASAQIVIQVKRALFDSFAQGATLCGGTSLSGIFCNTAGVGIDASVAGSVGELVGSNNQASDWVRIARVANVATTAKTISSGTPGRAGVNTTYVMSYVNRGPSAVPGVIFRDVFTLPANDTGFVLISAQRTGSGTRTCTPTAGAGVTVTATAGGNSYANPTSVAAQVTVQCPRLPTMTNNQTESLTVVIRPNINGTNTGRQFDNVADFAIDIDGDGNGDTTAGTDADGNTYDFNNDASDDSRSAQLPFESGRVDLITNKTDIEFEGGVDPLGYDASAAAANLITYRVTIRNSGPSVATNVRLVDTFNPQPGRTVTFVGAAPTPTGSFDPAACSVTTGANPTIGATQVLDCLMPGIGFDSNVPGVVASGQTSALYLRYRYDTPPGASGDTVNNLAEAVSNETDTNTANNGATQETTIRAAADLGVRKYVVTTAPDADPDAALPANTAAVTLRQPFFYVIDGINNGPGASLSRDRSGASPLNGTGTVVGDVLPAGLVVTGQVTWQKKGPVPAGGGGEVPNGTGTCTNASGTLECTLGDVTVGGKLRIVVPVRWDSWPGAAAIDNTATIATEQVDKNNGNDSSTVPILVTRSSLAGTVFEDRDRAGANGGTHQGVATEPGIAGVTLTLTGTDAYGNPVNVTTTTGSDGSYLFENLAPADASGYTLTQGQPAGYRNGPVDPPATGADAPSLGGSYGAGAPDSSYASIPMGAADSAVRYNFPEVRQPSLSGHVYIDANYNDKRDPGSDGVIAGATVELLNAATGAVVASTSTAADGSYRFDNLDPLIVYTLRQPLPTGGYRNRPTAVNPGLIGTAPCAAGCMAGTGVAGDPASTDRISTIDLGAGLDGTGFDFGEDAVATIGGSVYVDRNANGDFDAADAGMLNSRPNGGLEGVTVTLTGAGADGVFGNGDDPAPVVVLTDATGAYQFEQLVVGQHYRVSETQPAGYGNAAENASGVVEINALPASGSQGHDFGEKLGSLAGIVFEDFSANAAGNNNGLFDGGERPIAGTTVTLTGTDSSGQPVNIAVQSDAAGSYRFGDLLPPQAGSHYTVTETQPAGYIDGKHVAGNAATPGDASVANVVGTIAIDPGQDAGGYNFGELANVVIGGNVYLDRNDDGDRNGGDAGIPGTTLTIVGAGNDGVFGTADDTRAQVTSDANGDYSYGGAVSGQDYRIEETQPTGLAEGREHPADTITLTNLPLAGSSGNDFGELAGQLSGNVYLDANNNGVRDAGERGIAGVAVRLPAGSLDALGQPLAAATTDANGNYRFADLVAGTYAVTEQAAQPVVDGVTTLNGVTRAGTIDGAASGSATAVATLPSAIAAIVLPAGKASVANDFAEILPVSLAGKVFFDVNNDGAQAGAAETGITDVELVLTGTDDTGAAVNVSVRTDAGGNFVFEGLRPGTYVVTEPTQPAGTSNGITTPGQVAGASSGTATPVATVPSRIAGIGLQQPGATSLANLFGEIPLNSSISGQVWLDGNDNGVADGGEGGIAAVTVRLTGTDLQGNPVEREVVTDAQGHYAFTELPPGTYTVTEPQQPANTQNGKTVAGSVGGTATLPAVTPSAVSAIVLGVNQNAEDNNFGELPVGAIAGRVYSDNNDNGSVDAGETGIAGVTVVLSGSDDLGNAVNATATTDGEGRYRFDGLRPGTYVVTEPTQPPSTLNGITTAGSIDGTGVGTATGKDTLPSSIGAIVLPIGRDSLENNFGEIGDSPDMVVSKTATPDRFTVNNDASYSIGVRNVGQQPTRGEYVVHERLPAGIALAAVPAGTGWNCTGAIGDTRFSCRSSSVIASGATSTERIRVPVAVTAAAATGTPVNNAVLVEGGDENDSRAPTPAEHAAFDGDVTQLPACDPAITQNACRLPTQVQLAASVSGTVWFDVGGEQRLLDGGDQRLQGWTVELFDPASGQVARTAITGADGSYRIGDVIPGQTWKLRFRHPTSGAVWGWPVSGETAAGPAAPCAADAAIANGSASACRVSDAGVSELEVVLKAGENLPQQSLPVDPSGVVYDAVTRDPVPGSIVTLAPLGTCAGFDPATSLLNAGAGGYRIDGTSVSMTVGSDGFYQFLIGPAAPARCEFQLTVTPPGGYSFASALIPAEQQPLSPPGAAGGRYDVQPNAQAPTGAVGTATQYYLSVFAGSGTANIVHNHIPLDTAVATGLAITKTGDRQTAEIGDTVQYTITIRQTAGSPLQTVNVVDRLPRGFTYIEGTARANGVAAAEPLGKPGPTLGFSTGPIQVGQQIALTYRVRVGVGAQQGDGINRAQAHGCSIAGGCIDPVSLQPLPGSLPSNQAQYRVRVTGGVFTEEGCVLGKVFVDCNANHVQDPEEIGIPGVRLYFEDGTWVISDAEGKYSYCGLPPQSHTLKVDPGTLPVGSRLTTSSNRNLGDADSLFIDLKNGELHRADFIEGSCSNPVIEQVKARRTQGEVRAPESEAGQAPLRFSSKPARAPQQATDSSNQQPIVKPRRTEPPSASATPEVQP